MIYFNSNNTPYWDKMDQNFLQLVDNYLSSISNLPSFTITSTWRSPEHNQAVGGVPNSYHLVGKAIDIVFSKYISLGSTSDLDVIYYVNDGHYHFEPSKGSWLSGHNIGLTEEGGSLPLTVIIGIFVLIGIIVLVLR